MFAELTESESLQHSVSDVGLTSPKASRMGHAEAQALKEKDENNLKEIFSSGFDTLMSLACELAFTEKPDTTGLATLRAVCR